MNDQRLVPALLVGAALAMALLTACSTAPSTTIEAHTEGSAPAPPSTRVPHAADERYTLTT